MTAPCCCSPSPSISWLAALLAELLGAALAAQTAPEGYAVAPAALPGNASQPAVLPNGTAWFTGIDLQWLEPGQPVRTLLGYPAPAFGAFTLTMPGNVLLFADSSLGQVWLVPTAAGSPPALLTSIVLPYDAALLQPGRVVVSAKNGGFGAVDNDLVLLDLGSGVVTWLGSVAGASGAVAVDAQGGLVYATASAAFPPPPGSVQILRWSSVQVTAAQQGALPLSAANAQVLFTGLDAVGDLVLDGDGDLLFTDWMNNRVGELNDLQQVAWQTQFLDYAGAAVSPAAVQFVPGSGEFEPFAPMGGGELIVHETDWFATSRLRRIVPQPATVAAPTGAVPAGPLTLAVQQGPRQGLGLLALALAPVQGALTFAVPGFEQSLRWDGALLGGVTSLAGFDAQGTLQLGYVNPGFAPGLQLLVAAAFLDQNGAVVGSTAVVPLTLGN